MWSLLFAACKHEPTPHPHELDPCETPGQVCTWMGVPGEVLFSEDGLDRLETRLFLPMDITFSPTGKAYFSDFNNHRIRSVDFRGVVQTVSGTGFLGDGPNGADNDCWEGCDALSSAWNHPVDMTVSPSDPDTLWVAAWQNYRVAMIDLAASTVTWWAGSGAPGFADGEASLANFYLPSAVAESDDGALYVADQGNHIIRVVRDGEVSTLAGEPLYPGYSGDGGPAGEAHLSGGVGASILPGSKLLLDPSSDRLVLADTANGVIRAIDLETGIIETIAGRYDPEPPASYTHPLTGQTLSAVLGSIPGYSGDGGDALDALFNAPCDVAVGLDGELYIADTKNHCVRVVRDGIIETFAGVCTEQGFLGDGGPATDAWFDTPSGVAVDPSGNVYVADTINQVIRRIAR